MISKALLVSAGFVILGGLPAFGADSRPPNIVFLLADDAGYHDFGFQDSPALDKVTPNLDRLAAQGVRFTNAYASASMCAPSRAGILTGRYPDRFGFQQNYPESDSKLFKALWSGQNWRVMGLDLREKTMGDHLKANGYVTGLFGKWHEGYDDPYQPNRRGFDEFYGLRGGSRTYFGDPKLESAPPPHRYDRIEHNGQLIPEKDIGYVTNVFGQAAVDFIKAHQSQPFFVYLGFTAPHTPLEGMKEDVAWVKAQFPQLDEKRVANLAMTRREDYWVGQVRAALAQCGLEKNTVVIFAVDNGGSKRSVADNTPLRGFKFSPFEGGIRVPLLAYWPGVTQAGETINQPVSLLDLAPTFVGIAGGKTATDALPFDGISLSPLLKGQTDQAADRILCWREINSEGLTKIARQGDYKLIVYEKKSPELYNVVLDPSEKSNVAGQNQPTVQRLQQAIAEWETGMEPPRWLQY